MKSWPCILYQAGLISVSSTFPSWIYHSEYCSLVVAYFRFLDFTLYCCNLDTWCWTSHTCLLPLKSPSLTPGWGSQADCPWVRTRLEGAETFEDVFNSSHYLLPESVERLPWTRGNRELKFFSKEGNLQLISSRVLSKQIYLQLFVRISILIYYYLLFLIAIYYSVLSELPQKIFFTTSLCSYWNLQNKKNEATKVIFDSIHLNKQSLLNSL